MVMRKIGDHVVYPMHGGATISNIYEVDNDGVKMEYYVLKVLCNDLVVNVPVAQAEKLGMRDVSDRSVLGKLVEVLQDKPDVTEIKTVSWNRRQQMYIDRLKTGDMLKVAETYKMLWILESENRISVGERRLLRTSFRILQSEIMLIEEKDEFTVEAWLEEHTK